MSRRKGDPLTLCTPVHLPPLYWAWLQDRARDHALGTIHDVLADLIARADRTLASGKLRIRIKAGSLPV